ESVQVAADTVPPATPGNFPSTLKTSPLVNSMFLSTTDDGEVRLDLVVDGTTVASAEGTRQVSYAYDLTLPASAAGTQVTLKLVATDSAGRATSAQRTYTVEGNGNPPVVSFSSPPNGAIEGSTVHIVANASDVDGDLTSLTLLQDGVQIATSSTGTVS